MSAAADLDEVDDVDEFGIPVIPVPANLSQLKREAITAAALTEFLRSGYTAASVDAIAARASVSKPTVYKHFGSKERLFLAVIGGFLATICADQEVQAAGIVDAPELRAALVDSALRWTRLQLRADLLSLRRLVIGETERFPQLGRLWYRLSYAGINQPLTEALGELARRGALDVPDPVLAAQQLIAVTSGIPQLTSTFEPDRTPAGDELRRLVGSGVDLFLARYAVSAGATA